MAISIMTGTYMSLCSGTTSASTFDRLLARARAPAFGWYLSSLMARLTRSLVSSDTERLPLSTYETVLAATPACRATSASVATGHLLPAGRRPDAVPAQSHRLARRHP